MIRWTHAAFLFLLFSVCVSAETNYYPFTPNMRYQYRVQASRTIGNQAKDFNSSATIIKLQPQNLAGKTVYPERYEIGGEVASFSFVCEDHTGVFYVGTKGVHDSEPHVSSPFQYLIRYPLQIGTQWLQPSSEFELLNGNKKLAVELHADIAGTNETVIVPAGSFMGCLRISLKGDTQANDRAQFHIEKDLWYAPGVGLIKSIQKEERVVNVANSTANSSNGTFSVVMLLENLRSETTGSSGKEK